MDTIKRLKYSQYKEHYADCRTVPGTYDKINRSIEVIIPDGRMKPSGVRGERFHYYQLALIDADGKKRYIGYKAVCLENAMKQHRQWCLKNGWEALAEDQHGRTF